MSKAGNFILMLIPSSTVFISSACIMTLELVGGRLVARDLGASLYTWTSIIGVVLLGISIGNYAGGRIADRFPTRKTLSILFTLCSVACVLTIASNNTVSDIESLGKLSWPTRVVSHIAIVFLFPSIVLGTVSPVVAKRALEHGLAPGRTIGDLYAAGAIGSIAGTFATGFYLIAEFGTTTTIWGVGAVLLAMSIMYRPKSPVAYVWTAIFLALMIVANLQAPWAQKIGAKLLLRKPPDAKLLFETESQYNYISVRHLSVIQDLRCISLNNGFARNRLFMDDIKNLIDPYMKVYAAATSRLCPDKSSLSVLVIGGGGYIYPRYLEEVWPGSRIDVVEIDPQVTEAAMQTLGLSRNTTINILAMDARNYVDALLDKESDGQKIQPYDLVYGDAFNDFAVPYQLVTEEFNDKIARVLTDDGIYMLNIIDMYDSGGFIGALVNTIKRTFPTFYVVSPAGPSSQCNSFIIIAGKQPFTLEGLDRHEMLRGLRLETLDPDQIDLLARKADNIILTDNYAPVENLLAPAIVRAFQ